MARKIALQLEIDGVNQSVRSINDLENAIQTLEEELRGVEIGSERFKELSQQVNQARSQFKDLEESFEGQNLEQRAGAFAAVGESIVASFAGAQAALNLFGVESEELSQAAIEAQNLLTIAITARSVAEGVLQLRIVARTIAEKAANVATQTSIKLFRQLATVVSRNPYALILAGIGALVGAYISLRQEQEEQLDISKELLKVTSEEGDALKQQLTILTEYNDLKNIQSQTIDELVEKYPGFNAFIDEENKLTEQGVEFLELRIEQYVLEAQVQAILQQIRERQNELLEIENEDLEENIGFWTQIKSSILGALGPYGQVAGEIVKTTEALENQNEKTQDAQNDINRLTQTLRDLLGQLNRNRDAQKQYNDILEEQVEADERVAALTKAYDDGLNSLINYADALNKINKETKDFQDLINDISSQRYDAKILEEIQNIINLRNENIKLLTSTIDELTTEYEKLINLPEEDRFIRSFQKLRQQFSLIFPDIQKDIFEGLEQSFQNIISTSTQSIEELQVEFIKTLRDNNKNLTQEQEELLETTANNYFEFFKLLRDNEGLQKSGDALLQLGVDFETGQKQAESSIQALLFALGDLLFESEGVRQKLDDTLNISEVGFDPAVVKKNAETIKETFRTELFEPTARELLKTEKEILQERANNIRTFITNNTSLTGELRLEYEKQLEGLTGQITQIDTQLSDLSLLPPETIKIVQDQIEVIISQFLELGGAATNFEQGIIKVQQEIRRLGEIADDQNIGQAIGGFILQNIDAISNAILGIEDDTTRLVRNIIKNTKAESEDFLRFRENLARQGFNVEKASYDDLLQAYIEYKKREVQATKDSEEEKQKLIQNTFDNIVQGFEIFSNFLFEAETLLNERVNNSLEALSISREKQLSQVVGDTEEANKKRIEIEEQYNERVKQLEKEARLASLRISLATSIANAAAASIRAIFELGPIAGPIVAGLNAVLLTAQIATIQDQIGIVESLRRGGLVKYASDGMLLRGASHEKGGIPLAQFGVIAEGQESVINRQSTTNYGELLSSINMAGGGRPLVVNQFDDTRIIEELSKTKNTPIKAYVLSSEITDNQQLNNRLETLSKL